MKNVKTALRITLKAIGALLLFLIAFVIVEVICTKITVNSHTVQVSNGVAIYIKTNGVHTDIVVPVRYKEIDWAKEVQFANTKGQDTTFSYLGMGWGDKGFYLETPTWADLKFSVAFKAVTGLSTTAIHATYYHALTENESCRKIVITEQQYAQLVQFITSSFQKNQNAHFIPIVTNANYGMNDAFYEANGSYSLFHTCNTWANAALKSCDQKACLWTIFDKGIFSKYQ